VHARGTAHQTGRHEARFGDRLKSTHHLSGYKTYKNQTDKVSSPFGTAPAIN
jgi:hypothetical protein